MAAFKVETYVIKPEKQEEHMALVKKFVALKEKNPQKSKELKSWKLFAQKFGGNNCGGYVEMSEFENLADVEKFSNRMMQDKEFMTTIVSSFISCTVPASARYQFSVMLKL